MWELQVTRITEEFPKFRVLKFQDSWFFSLLLKFNFRAAAVTVRNTVFMDPDLMGTERGAETLKHEVVHMRQQKKWGVLFFLSYFLLLPIGPSFKAIWEWPAYKEDLKSVYEEYKSASPAYLEYIMGYYGEWVAKQFWSPLYAWMWPFPKFVRNMVAKFVATLGKSDNTLQ